ncbi:hypothetical protein [Nostoc sp.]|uniref:hypothetical protein n=1 Tax=Nostoc sp. TaxID=1180 RepID=UPI002FF8F351
MRSRSLDNKLGDRIKLSNPQLTIRVLCLNLDDCVLIKLIYKDSATLNSPSQTSQQKN